MPRDDQRINGLSTSSERVCLAGAVPESVPTLGHGAVSDAWPPHAHHVRGAATDVPS